MRSVLERMRRLTPARRYSLPVYFMHVPKSAGTSILSLLRANVHPNKVCPTAPYGTWTWHAREVRGYHLYAGHFSADFLEAMGKRGTRLIMLRHPLPRTISLYDYWRSHTWDHIRTSLPPTNVPAVANENGPAIAKAGNLTDFLNTESRFAIRHIYNAAARQLLGRRYDALWPDQDAVTFEAIKALRTYDWVGVAEEFAASARMLCDLLDLTEPSSEPQENTTYEESPDPSREPIDKTVPTAEQRERILTGNRIDIAIHREAQAIVQMRMRRCST